MRTSALLSSYWYCLGSSRLISALLGSSQLFSVHLSFSLLFAVLLGLSQFPPAFLKPFQLIMNSSRLCSASRLISLLLRSSQRRSFGPSTLLISAEQSQFFSPHLNSSPHFPALPSQTQSISDLLGCSQQHMAQTASRSNLWPSA